jgi:hypothetical protein
MDKLSAKIMELKAERNRLMICRALNMSAGEYHTKVFDTGMTWIKECMCLKDDAIANVIGSCKLFWAWWRNHWHKRDEKFVYETNLPRLVVDQGARNMLHELYKDAHNVDEIGILPNRIVLDEVSTAMRAFTRQEVERLKVIVYGK